MSHNRIGNESPHSHLLQGISILIFTVVWILDSLILNFSTLLNNYIPLIVRIIIFISILIIAYLVIRKSEKILFKQPENRSELIIEGIFSHVRHPLYLGVLLIYLAFIWLSISLLAIAVWIITIIIYD
ncbi:MAG: DUF1295 domain-containing protein, partial [Candidatus Heimdallarchaeota archaeon]